MKKKTEKDRYAYLPASGRRLLSSSGCFSSFLPSSIGTSFGRVSPVPRAKNGTTGKKKGGQGFSLAKENFLKTRLAAAAERVRACVLFHIRRRAG